MDDYEQAELDYAEEGDKPDLGLGLLLLGTIASCAFGPMVVFPSGRQTEILSHQLPRSTRFPL